jgi:hypothetical protein
MAAIKGVVQKSPNWYYPLYGVGSAGFEPAPSGDRPDFAPTRSWTDQLLVCQYDRVMDDLALRVFLDASLHLREEASDATPPTPSSGNRGLPVPAPSFSKVT